MEACARSIQNIGTHSGDVKMNVNMGAYSNSVEIIVQFTTVHPDNAVSVLSNDRVTHAQHGYQY